MRNGMLSVIVPAYNEKEMVPVAASILGHTLENEGISYEIIFVNDGSKDNTWQKIQEACEQNEHIHGITFSRNFGKEAAMYAGLFHSKGDCAVLIDCDLQHPPEKIPQMYNLWQEGYEVIEGVKTCRGEESGLHALFARWFYGMMSTATGIDMSRASDFKLLGRQAIDAILEIREKDAFLRALSAWVGFKSTHVEFEVRDRTAGQSKWSFVSLFHYALNNVTAFSTKPMQIVTLLGLVIMFVSFVMGLIAFIQKLFGIAQPGFTTVIILLLFIGSMIMISLGIIGYYIAKIYMQSKDRPRFIVAEKYEMSNKAEKRNDNEANR